MTRDFTFVLTAANQWYNLWNDLITKDSSYDATASYGPFVPSVVCELKFQNQVPGVNIYRSDSKLESGFRIHGSPDKRYLPDVCTRMRYEISPIDIEPYMCTIFSEL